MLIILPEPSPSPELDVLAVNLNSYDTIGIRRLHSCFQLVVHKYFDAKFALDSAIFFVLVNLESRGFVVIPKIRFIKFVDSRSTEVLRDSVPLKEDVVVEAGVFDMRFLWKIKQTGHRGDRHDSRMR